MLWPYEAFILDFDGTLVDSGKYHARAFADAVLAQSGYQLTRDEHHEFFGKHSTWFTEVLNDRYGLALDPDRVLAQKRARVQEIFEAELFDGAREFLERWHGRKPMALATNSPLSFVLPALKNADLLRYFNFITTADEVTHRKPSPEIIEVSLRKLRVRPQAALVFEDQLIGVEAARSAGAGVILVNNNQPVEHPADVPVHSWAELIRLSEER